MRILHTAAKSSGQVYDVYLMANGENSKAYDESVIVGITPAEGVTTARTEIFSINGARLQTLTRGINIIRRTFTDGTVKTQKVVVR